MRSQVVQVNHWFSHIYATVLLTFFLLIICSRCIPDDGGDVCYTMTELQPSPPGYRGQDEAPGPPGPPSCVTAPYSSQHFQHSSQAAAAVNYKAPTVGYNQEQQQQQQHNNSNNSYGIKHYHGRRVTHHDKDHHPQRGGKSSSSDNNEIGDDNNVISHSTAYYESYKKNTPGYKNDSGLIASLYLVFFYIHYYLLSFLTRAQVVSMSHIIVLFLFLIYIYVY